MADLFYSARLTLKRAEHHIREFKSSIDGCLKQDAWSAPFIERHSETGKHIHKVKFIGELPESLPCILFDIANNLRAVLDQSGYASAVAAGSPILKAVKFPFGPTEDKWKQNLAGGCKDLPPEIRSIFEGYKGHERGNSTLWALNEIANTKKHLALIPLPLEIPRLTFSTDPDVVLSHADGTLGAGWDSEKREFELAILPPDKEPKIRGHIAASIAIEGIEVLRGQDARLVVDRMRNEVRNCLIATTAKCRDLGFNLGV